MADNIIFPSNNNNLKTNIEFERTLVIIGANGTGKSKLGAFIETNNYSTRSVIRIGAQRALNFSAKIPYRHYTDASDELQWGHPNYIGNITAKWGDSPTTMMRNDFDITLSTLFAQENERNKEYTNNSRNQINIGGNALEIPKSKIEKLVEIWNLIMPHRSIHFEGGEVKVINNENNDSGYHAKEMSDGERVALYLLGQCLCAPENSILIIDEPEIHLHVSLMASLWNSLEQERYDCAFIYITHDLEFASSRLSAKKLWIKKMPSVNIWEWEEVPTIGKLPENLVLEIIGTRKKILFTEGLLSSIDFEIFSAVYKNFNVIPLESCQKVIDVTKSVRASNIMPHIDCKGIIDNDYRSAQQVSKNETDGIYTLNFADIENLLCAESVIKFAANELSLDSAEVFEKVKGEVFSKLKSEIDVQIYQHTNSDINSKLNFFNAKYDDSSDLQTKFNSHVQTLDLISIFNLNSDLYHNILNSEDYELALKHYNRKSLVDIISGSFNLNTGEYKNLIIRFLKNPSKNAILIEILKKLLPDIE